MKPTTWGWHVGEIDVEVAAALGDARTDMDVLGVMAIVVEERLAFVDAILPARDDGADLPFGAVEHGLDRGMGGGRAELRQQLRQPALAEPGRAYHCREIAPEVAGMADVEHDQLVDVLAPHALVVEFQRRDAEAFLEDLGGGGVVGAVRGAADVALVRAVDRPEGKAVAVEHRHERRQVRQVIAAPIGIVEQVDIARTDRALEEIVHGPGRIRQRADVDRHMLGLRDQATLGVAQRGGEVAARIEDLRVGGPQHGLAHLLHDGVQPVLDHGDGDRIDDNAHAAASPGAGRRGML